MLDLTDQQNDIWIWDLGGETLSRLTFDAGVDVFGVWTPDGQKVIFSSDREGDNRPSSGGRRMAPARRSA